MSVLPASHRGLAAWLGMFDIAKRDIPTDPAAADPVPPSAVTFVATSSVTAKISAWALLTISSTSSSAAYPIWVMRVPASTRRRSTARSCTISA